MQKFPLKVAILGSTGHIAQNLIFYFSQNKGYELFLFSRNKNKIKKNISKYPLDFHFHIKNYNNFKKFYYDVIINCVGISNPKTVNANKVPILRITEQYDNLILGYLEKHKSTLYIFISSGAAYGKEFPKAVTDITYAKFNINNLTHGDFYSIAKINAEAKHRSLKHLNIIDLRIFTFFSSFLDVHDSFLMSEIVSSLKNKKILYTNSIDITRDYVHPSDLYTLIKKCIKNPTNDVFDVYSKKPISKFEILKSISKRFGLKYVIKKDLKFFQPTGIKKNYYSKSTKAKKIEYKPKYSSLETILDGIQHLL